MPVLLWLLVLVGGLVSLVQHALLATALFLASAFLFSLGDEDAAAFGYIIRVIAAAWAFGAVRVFVLRAVLQRPPTSSASSRNKKPSGLRTALGLIGCLGSVLATVVVYVLGGQEADWVVAGIVAGAPDHPARVALDTGLRWLDVALSEPRDVAAPVAIVAGVLIVTTRLADWARREQRRLSAERPGARGTSGAPPTPATTVSPTVTSLDDLVLGRVTWDGGSRRWRATAARDRVGAVLIETGGAPPTDDQLRLARGIVQRDFEVLIRASDGARPQALARGVGLPRFVVDEAVVHADEGPQTMVTLRLRCPEDPNQPYSVRSADGMQTFSPV